MNNITNIHSSRVHDAGQTINEQFAAVANQHPNNLALACTHQRDDLSHTLPRNGEPTPSNEPYLRWTLAALERAVSAVATNLSLQGLEPGSPFFLVCSNRAEFVIVALAAFKLNLILVPLDPGNVFHSQQDFEYKLDFVKRSFDGKPLGILAGVTEIAMMDKDLISRCCTKVSLDGAVDGWIQFGDLLWNTHPKPQEEKVGPTVREERAIFFTSGTTSRPKGCLANMQKWFDALQHSISPGRASVGDVIAVATPIHHAFGFICTILPLLKGACVVLASDEFDPGAVSKAIVLEKCTILAVVPTMIHTLKDTFSHSPPPRLTGIIFAAMPLTPTVVGISQEIFRPAWVENFFGMSEGVFLCTGPQPNINSKMEDSTLPVGRPVVGSRIRICDSDDNIVPPNAPGSIHYAADTLVDYLGIVEGAFYPHDGRKWFITGDEGFLSPDGQLYLTGRSKDIIVRGGVNLSPARIESVLAPIPELRSLDIQIVAHPDPIAGEVPVAVTSGKPGDDTLKLIQDSVRSELGSMFIPTKIIELHSLGLTDYPRTSVGKVMKSSLVALVASVFKEQMPHSSPCQDLSHQVITVWCNVLGLSETQINTSLPISQPGDSILLLIARDRIQKATSKKIPLSGWLGCNSIEEQITFLESADCAEDKPPVVTSDSSASDGSRPLEIHDLAHIDNNESYFARTKQAVEETVATFDLSWANVTEVFPCTDFVRAICRNRAVDTWNIRATVVSKNATREAMRSALEEALAQNPILLSFIVPNSMHLPEDVSLHVVIRQTPDILDRVIQDYGAVDSVTDLEALAMDYPFKDPLLPGPLFSALILFVRETNSAAVITNISHAVVDKPSHMQLHQDLDDILSQKQVQPHTSFAKWANTYHSLRTSPAAQEATTSFQRYLHNIDQHSHVLWPYPTRSLTVTAERATTNGHILKFFAPSLTILRQKHPHLTAPTLMKAALALLVVSRTNHSHALFLNFEACRSRFPFTNPSTHSQDPDSPDAVTVAGPTMNGVINLIPFHPAEPVLSYLNRIHSDQTNFTKYAHVPWAEVFRDTAISANEFVGRIAESLIFNWIPGLGALTTGRNPFEAMEMTQVAFRPKVGMLVSAGLAGDEGTEMVIMLHGAVANNLGMWVERVAEELKRVFLWLCREEVWGVPVRGFVGCIH